MMEETNMNIIGCKIRHIKLGEGTVVEFADKKITVDFGGKKSKFAVETLEKFFTFENTKDII